MAVDLSDRVREIAQERGVPESEVFEQAIERGIDSMWSEIILARYVDGAIDREEAVELVGIEAVRRTDREVAAVEEDVRWGLET